MSARIHHHLADTHRSLRAAPVWVLLTLCLASAPARAEEASSELDNRKVAETQTPELGSERVIVIDAATEAILLAKNERKVGGIASTTKIFVAMVVRDAGIDLDATTAINREDASFARGGSRTRMDLHHSFKHIDLLRAMLVSSDNRAPTALGRAVGLSPKKLVAAMNKKARKLGLKHTEFTDPSGLRGNDSTASDMALAFKALLADPVLAEIVGTRDVTVRSIHSKPRSIYYRNTNQPLHDENYQVFAGKTGYTRKAGYCLLVAARFNDREVIMVFLGGKSKSTRFNDFYSVARWLKDGYAPALDRAPRVKR